MQRLSALSRIARALVMGTVFGLAVGTAQAFPDRPITLLIPYPPGGSADMLARPLAPLLQRELGQPVVLEYRPGAGGTIASAQLARAKPDGHTLIMALAAHTINPSLYPSLPYDTRKDFAPVSMIATLPMLVVAPLATPANTVQELVDYARQHPDALTFASAGNGNTSHLAGEMFKSLTDTRLLHIPYKGSGPAVVALLAGEVSVMFDSISTSLPQVRAGKLKALAVTSATRAQVLPDVPTVAESGVPDYVVNGWYGILAPAGTPGPVIERLNAAFVAAAADPKVRSQLQGYGYTLQGTSLDAFARHIEQELAQWRRVVQESGAQVQ